MQKNEFVASYFKRFNNAWSKEPPANEASIAQLRLVMPQQVPDEYLEFLRHSNGGSGNLPVRPGMFDFWPAEEIAQHNKLLRVTEEMPGFLAFGRSGGGSIFLFDTREISCPVYVTSAIGMGDQEVTFQIADDFCSLLKMLGEGEWPNVDENEP